MTSHEQDRFRPDDLATVVGRTPRIGSDLLPKGPLKASIQVVVSRKDRELLFVARDPTRIGGEPQIPSLEGRIPIDDLLWAALPPDRV